MRSTYLQPSWGRGTGPDGSQTGPRDHGTTRAHRTGPPGHRFWIWDHQSKPGWGRGTGPDGSQTGPRDHAGTPNGSTGPPNLDLGPHDLSQPGDETRGQTGARRHHGTTGPRDHGTTRAHRRGHPGNRFWIGRAMIKAIKPVRTPYQLAVWGKLNNSKHGGIENKKLIN